MAAKLGILGETVSLSLATTTVYTVPADKAATITVEFGVIAGAGTTRYSIMIGTPGTECTMNQERGTSVDMIGGPQIRTASGGTAQTYVTADSGFYFATDAAGGPDLDPSGGAWICIPFGATWQLSTGDTVRVAIDTTAPLDHLFRVMGVEDDA